MDNNNNLIEEKLPIYTIQIKPRNQIYCNYIVNNSLSHSKKYDELSVYLASLLPDKKKEIFDLIDLKKHFIIFLQEKKIVELKINFHEEIKKLTDEHKHDNINKIKIDEKMNNKQSLDFQIKDISKINLYKNFKKDKLF
jgi:hypothetical protein